MTFEEDLTKRRINVAAFAAGDPERYAAWQTLYGQVHPNTFYTSVKMIINEVRRQFWLAEVPKPAVGTAPAAAKPVMRRATGTVPSSASAIPDEPSPSVDRTPETTPRTRPVIQRPPATQAAIPEPNELAEEKSASAEDQVNAPEAPKPGRARPVFRRPATETPANPFAENEAVPENKATITPEATNPPAEPAKPPRPRPVFRKPATPEIKAAEPELATEIPTENAAPAIPEPRDPEPSAVSKPPRPRPVFKRPSPSISAETENTTAMPESTVPVANTNAIPETIGTTAEKPVEVNPETPKPPRPRPIFKKPAPAENLEEKPAEPTAENNPALAATPEPPKFPRPRPVMKRPVVSTEPTTTESPVSDTKNTSDAVQEIQNLKNNEQLPIVNEPGSTTVTPATEPGAEPVVPKPPRPRPIFKRPSASGSSADTPLDKPETE